MTEAQTILKMIETVDPTDTKALDEIDVLVWECKNKSAWCDLYIGTMGADSPPMEKINPPQYTRSRDALKAIRPEGWWCDVLSTELGTTWFSTLGKMKEHQTIKRVRSNILATEELAELHAIIQAIECERSKL